MKPHSLKITFLGLSITSSWGNGHATTYRGLVRELAARGHDVLFLERDMPWYSQNRDLPSPPYGRTALYSSLEELRDRYAKEVRGSDCVIVGSYVPEGVAVSEWATSITHGIKAFYDIDTPVTLAKLARADYEYLSPALIPRFDLYCSFTGGPTLRKLERQHGAKAARVLYCSTDPALYHPEPRAQKWDLGYLGTYSSDRQPALDGLLLEPARRWKEGRFAVAGPLYPQEIEWPGNTVRFQHFAPRAHGAFYNSQRFTLNITRRDMIRAGYSPSVRLFEAAACGVPIISDAWKGLGTIFRVGTEVLVSRSPEDTLRYLREIPEEKRIAIGARARARVLASHTAAHRAEQLEGYIVSALDERMPRYIPASAPGLRAVSGD